MSLKCVRLINNETIPYTYYYTATAVDPIRIGIRRNDGSLLLLSRYRLYMHILLYYGTTRVKLVQIVTDCSSIIHIITIHRPYYVHHSPKKYTNNLYLYKKKKNHVYVISIIIRVYINRVPTCVRKASIVVFSFQNYIY